MADQQRWLNPAHQQQPQLRHQDKQASDGQCDGRPSSFPTLQSLSRSLSFVPIDTFLFRAPEPSYNATTWPGELCVLGGSVCLALERKEGASRVALFFHGTSSDLGIARASVQRIRNGLQCHVVAVDCPGYGLHKGVKPSEESHNEAARRVFLHLTGPMGWARNRVILIGRSLGSGPACRLAREFRPGCLILLAPFASVKGIARDIVGEALTSILDLSQWNNQSALFMVFARQEELTHSACPLLLVHGVLDKTVPHTHSLELYRSSCSTTKYVCLLHDSNHNRMNWPVVAGVYGRPFIDHVCPHTTNRPLGVRPRDVAELARFDMSTPAHHFVVRAEVAWQRKRAMNGHSTSPEQSPGHVTTASGVAGVSGQPSRSVQQAADKHDSFTAESARLHGAPCSTPVVDAAHGTRAACRCGRCGNCVPTRGRAAETCPAGLSTSSGEETPSDQTSELHSMRKSSHSKRLPQQEPSRRRTLLGPSAYAGDESSASPE